MNAGDRNNGSAGCQICGEASTGFHYGVWCCNSCKCFFRRCVIQKRDFRCRTGEKQCMIRQESRNACRACRYAKCIAVGLDPKTIRSDSIAAMADELPKHPGFNTPETNSVRNCSSTYSNAFTPSSIMGLPVQLPGQPSWITSETNVAGQFSSSSNLFTPSSMTTASVQLPDQLGLNDGKLTHLFSSMSNSSTMSTVLENGCTEAATQLPVGNHLSMLTSSGIAAGMSTSYYPLASISGLLGSRDLSTESLSRYFVMVERLCESYRDTSLNCASSHVTYDLNASVDRVFLEPRSLIPRTAVDWEARYLMTPEANHLFPRQWCRLLSFYTDWASHIPELQLLDLDDRVRLLACRLKQCCWLWAASRSITRAAGKVVIFGDGGCYPLDPVEQARVSPEVNNLFQPLCNFMNTEIIRPALDIQVREEELALLNVLCFCVPVAGLKTSSHSIIQSAQAKYQAALVEEVMKHPAGQGVLGDIARLMKIMSWLVTTERIAEEGNKYLSLMALFNIAEMKGSLTYELHVRSD